MLETTSSFGSTSSSPSLANLPSIRVHVEDGGGVRDQKVVGIEDQLAQMTVGGGGVRDQLCHRRRRCLFQLRCRVCLLAVKWLLVSIKIGFSLMMKDSTTGFLFVIESRHNHSLKRRCRL